MMKQTMSPFQAIVRELAAALGVLALVFLSFSHQPIDPAPGQGFRLADGSIPVFCGSAPDSERQGAGYKCEACRLSFGLNLPEAACSAGAVFQQAERVSTTEYDVIQPMGLINRVGHPRAPPFARIFS